MNARPLFFIKLLSLIAVFIFGIPPQSKAMIEPKMQENTCISQTVKPHITQKNLLKYKVKAEKTAPDKGKLSFTMGIIGLALLILAVIMLLYQFLNSFMFAVFGAFISSILAIIWGKKAGKDSEKGRKGKGLGYIVFAITIIPVIILLAAIFGAFDFSL